MILYLILERNQDGTYNYRVSNKDFGPRLPRLYTSLARAKLYAKGHPTFHIKKIHTDTLPEIS